jgi:hypothetical protein
MLMTNNSKLSTELTLDHSVVMRGEEICVNFRFENTTGRIMEFLEPEAYPQGGFDELWFENGGYRRDLMGGDEDVGTSVPNQVSRSAWIGAGEILTRRYCSFGVEPLHGFTAARGPGRFELVHSPSGKYIQYTVVKPNVLQTAASVMGESIIRHSGARVTELRLAGVLEFEGRFYVVVSLRNVTACKLPGAEPADPYCDLAPFRRVAETDEPVTDLHFEGLPGVDHRLVWAAGTEKHSIPVPFSAALPPLPGAAPVK